MSNPDLASTIQQRLDRLALFPPTDLPVISLYLNTQADQHGQDHHHPFVRKEFRARARTLAPRSPERESFDRDIERIEEYLRDQLAASTNSLALFSCYGAGGFFDALQLAAPVDENGLYVGRQPHLYPLARVQDQYRRFAVLLVDSTAARIYVFGMGKTLDEAGVSSDKTRRTQMGGWSQARYQRNVDNFRRQHLKEVADVLERVVKRDGVDQVFLAGDEVSLPTLREQLPESVRALVASELRLDMRTPEHEIMAVTLEAMRRKDAQTDQEKVFRLLDEYRAGALGVAGARDSLVALTAGQVDELIVSARPEAIQNDIPSEERSLLVAPEAGTGNRAAESAADPSLADALVARARQTGATVTFIEDAALLEPIGGVGALLRYRI